MQENMKNKRDCIIINTIGEDFDGNKKFVKFWRYHYASNDSRCVLASDMCLDIETSKITIGDQLVPFITSIQVYFEDKYYLFRKPTEFMKFLLKIKKCYALGPLRVLKIFIHNIKNSECLKKKGVMKEVINLLKKPGKRVNTMCAKVFEGYL